METLRYATASSPVGQILVCVSEKGIRTLSVGAGSEVLVKDLSRQFPTAKLVDDATGLVAVLAKIDKIWSQPKANVVLPLDPTGTAFQRSVWKELGKIPCGSTITYGELARRVGNPKSVRAAAQACGANPVLFLIPCHRVVGANGALTGFRAGIETKKWLLQNESAILA